MNVKEFCTRTMCPDCGHYHDCPLEYICPPMEIIIECMTNGATAKPREPRAHKEKEE